MHSGPADEQTPWRISGGALCPLGHFRSPTPCGPEVMVTSLLLPWSSLWSLGSCYLSIRHPVHLKYRKHFAAYPHFAETINEPDMTANPHSFPMQPLDYLFARRDSDQWGCFIAETYWACRDVGLHHFWILTVRHCLMHLLLWEWHHFSVNTCVSPQICLILSSLSVPA